MSAHRSITNRFFDTHSTDDSSSKSLTIRITGIIQNLHRFNLVHNFWEGQENKCQKNHQIILYLVVDTSSVYKQDC